MARISDTIGSMVGIVSDIAAQTNLLALNATSQRVSVFFDEVRAA